MISLGMRMGSLCSGKQCEACGAELVQRAAEKAYRFAKRRHCGVSCALRNRNAPIAPTTRYRRTRVNGRMMQLSRHLTEQHLGRPLLATEIVHHANHDKLDDRIDNYEITSSAEHSRHHNQKYPLTWDCAVCGATFTPSPSKRGGRRQTCGRVCQSALMSLRHAARRNAPPAHQT